MVTDRWINVMFRERWQCQILIYTVSTNVVPTHEGMHAENLRVSSSIGTERVLAQNSHYLLTESGHLSPAYNLQKLPVAVKVCCF